MSEAAIDYINVEIPEEDLALLEVPLVRATDRSLEGYGRLVDRFEDCEIEIVRWPAQGWRPVDPGTGDQGGTVTGIFTFEWRGDMLFGTNGAVDDRYLLGWSCDPRRARQDSGATGRSRVLLWHANYHPDGGQLFFPEQRKPFVVPLALPGDDVRPERFVAFYCDGSQGLYIHPNVWHEAVFPLGAMSFRDRQGAVHGRVSVDFRKEFGCYLDVPLRAPAD